MFTNDKFELKTIRAAKKLAEELKLKGFTVKYVDLEWTLYRAFGDYEIIISSLCNRNKYWIDLWQRSSTFFYRLIDHKSDVPKTEIMEVVKAFKAQIKNNTKKELAA